MKVLPVLALLLAPALALSATAQQPAPAPATPTSASVVGTVFDSVRGRPMVGAIVRVDTSALVATSDHDGYFRLEGIAAGQHQLRVEHAVIDTIGIALVSPREPYTAGTTATLELATPSAESLIGMLCSGAWQARGPAALIGRVREADTGVPATGAKVSLVWYELTVSAGVKRVPRVRETMVGANGTYRICGLPAQLDGRVQVIRGPLTSGEITISFGDDLLFMRSMSIVAAGAVAAVGDSAQPKGPVVLGTARLTGKVVNRAGQPLGGARVQLEGTTRATQTRPNGEFVLDSLPPGTQSLSVRLLGYAPMDEAVDLISREPRSITIAMTDFVPVLAQVRVTAQREKALDAVGFLRRKKVGQGFYLDGDAINHQSLMFSDVLRQVPGLRVMPGGSGKSVVTNSRNPNGCVVFWIDGTMWQEMEPGDIDDFLKPHELAAVEVYSGATAPVEFQVSGQGSCTTVVAWTARRLDRNKR